jgi:hypothetical protein
MSASVSQRAARQHMQKRRRRLQAIGQWQSPDVDAAPVRAHVLALREAGMSEAAVISRLNLPQSALKNVMRGANGRPPGRTVLRETAEAVLAYWPTLDDFPDTALIDATGTRRRTEALAVLGWSGARLAREIGMGKDNFNTCLRGQRVSARFARKVASLYDRLWSQKPEDHGVQGQLANRTRKQAASAGLHGPLAWDDETIDDPKTVPLTDALEPVTTEGENIASRWLMGESVILGRIDRREVLQHLFEWTNDTMDEIAAKLDMTPDAAERQWERIKEKAKADGRRVWRRVYVPRERNLNQNEMEEVA